MMERYEEVFLSLVRSGMWGTAPEVPEGFNEWGKVARLAKSQSVLGVVGEVMLTDPTVAGNIDTELKAKIKSFMMSNMLTHGMLNGALVKVVRTLRSSGIGSVLLKGQGLAHYYPKPELRQCGDIDLYVGMEKYADAYDVLKPLATKIDDKKALAVGKHFDLEIGRAVIEVHRYTDTYPTKRLDRAYQKASLEGLQDNLIEIDFNGVMVNTPSDVYNAFYVFSHLFHHFLINGLGSRHLCDWMRFLHVRKDNIDLNALGSLLKEVDMLEPWQTFGCVLVKVLGMQQDEFPFYNPSYEGKVQTIIERMIEEGNFGKERDVYKKRGKIYLINKTWAMFAHIGRTFGLLFLFPRHSFRQIWHTMTNGFAKVFNDAAIRFGRRS